MTTYVQIPASAVQAGMVIHQLGLEAVVVKVEEITDGYRWTLSSPIRLSKQEITVTVRKDEIVEVKGL